MKNIQRVVSLAVTMVFLGITSSAFAATVTTYAGSDCQPNEPASKHYLSAHGDIVNLEKLGATWYRCPITRHNPAGNASAIQKVKVRIKDASTQYFVTCTVYTVQSNGNSFKKRGQSTTRAGTGWETFNIGAISATANGSYYLQCALPYNSSVINYQVFEK